MIENNILEDDEECNSFIESFWPKKSTHHKHSQEHEHCCYAIHGVAEELLPVDDT